ncbi:conserved protein of unknown function (plasmid) [Pararobbsia alpina]|uniref:hypothetical protein n=1 Tax=Pararobbsia alpina TaxID=621374 RepID=UPI0039A455D8
MKILGYELPDATMRTVERRMAAGSFEAFDVRRVLLREFRSQKTGPHDAYRTADAAATRLIRHYAERGVIKKVDGTRRWVSRPSQEPQRPTAMEI